MHVKKNYIWNPATCSCENVEYSASTIDDAVITCDEIINTADSVTSTVSINFYNKKVRYKMVILLFIIAIILYQYAKNRSNQKRIDPLII